MPHRGLFVTGTDTGAGKSVLSACLAAAMCDAGLAVRAHKPVLTGLDDPPGAWPADHELLARATGQQPEEIAPLRFGPAVSPHLAAEMAGTKIELDTLLAAAGAAGEGSDVLLVEGVGGLLVPLGEGASVRDLARALALPLLVAARPGLGTINHTLLTLEAAAAAGLEVRAVVLGPWPQVPGEIETSNAATIERLGGVEVATLPELARAGRAELAGAGAALPWQRWLDAGPA